MTAALIAIPSAPVEVILCSEFREGPVTGVVRAPSLAQALPGVTELVYGPARRAWRSEPAAERTYFAAPVPAGTAQQLLDACSWPERWRTAPVFDVSCDPPPAHIGILLGPFKSDVIKSAHLVMRFERKWTAARVWHAANNEPIDLNAVADQLAA